MRAFRRAVEEARDETVCAQPAPAQRSQPAAPQCAKPERRRSFLVGEFPLPHEETVSKKGFSYCSCFTARGWNCGLR